MTWNPSARPRHRCRFPRRPRHRRLAHAWFGVVLAALALPGCESPARLAPLPQDAVILAFGDSLTHGTGAGPAESYPARLEAAIGRKVVNAGVPGEETDAGRARLPQLLERHHPALVILLHGGNDFLRKRDPARTEANLRAMIQTATAHGAQVLLVAVPRPGLLLRDDPMYARLARAFGLPLVEDILGDLLRDPSLKSDPVHLNARGYAQLAQTIAQALAKAGAI